MGVTITVAAMAVVFATGRDLLRGADEFWRHLDLFGAPLGNLFLGGIVLTIAVATFDFVRSVKEIWSLKPSPSTILRAIVAGCLVMSVVAYIHVAAHLVWIYWPALIAGVLGGALPVVTGTAIKAMGAEEWPLPGYIHMPPLVTSGMTAEQREEAEDRHFIARMPIRLRATLGL